MPRKTVYPSKFPARLLGHKQDLLMLHESAGIFCRGHWRRHGPNQCGCKYTNIYHVVYRDFMACPALVIFVDCL